MFASEARRYLALTALSSGFSFVAPTAASATAVYVPDDHPTILEAMEHVAAGDTVCVLPGTYSEPYQIQVVPGSRLIGLGGAAITHLYVEQLFIGDDPGTTLRTVVEGFSLTSGSSTIVRVFGNPRVTLRNNELTAAECIYSDCPMVIENNVFRTDDVFSGGAIMALSCDAARSKPGDLIITGNEFLVGQYGYGIAFGVPPCIGMVENGVFSHNTVVFPNIAGGWSACYYAPGAPLEVSNNVFYAHQIACCDTNVSFQYNCFWEVPEWYGSCDPGCVALDETNVLADPLLCDPEGWPGDYRLQPGSPCIGSGQGGANMGAREVGCQVVTVGEEPQPRLPARLHPNPSRGPVAVTLETEITDLEGFEVFDVSGRRVWRAASPVKGDVLVWPGTDLSGGAVPPGVYYVRVTGSGSVERTMPVHIVR